MVADTSALIAILFREPEAERFEAIFADAAEPVVSAVALVELGMVALGRRGFTPAEIEDRLQGWGLTIKPVTAGARLALNAFARQGKGRHGARLNFGDCFAYALARERAEPPLFKGDDFSRTDVTAAA